MWFAAGSWGRLLQHFDELPGLATRHRTARSDLHQIPIVRLALLVMSQQLRGATDELAVHAVFDEPLDLDGDRLLHLGAHHATREGAGTFGFNLALFRAHFFSPVAALMATSRCTVLRRAILRRTF